MREGMSAMEETSEGCFWEGTTDGMKTGREIKRKKSWVRTTKNYSGGDIVRGRSHFKESLRFRDAIEISHLCQKGS